MAGTIVQARCQAVIALLTRIMKGETHDEVLIE